MDHSITNSDGLAVGITYYDKPVLSGDSEIASAINAYFEDECQEFFFGKNRINFFGSREYAVFEGCVYTFLSLTNSLLSYGSSFYNTVRTEATYNSDEILSFAMNTYWTVGGVNTGYSFGTTFDMHTGELVTLDCFFDISITQFLEKIEEFIIMRFMEWYDEDYVSSLLSDPLRETLGSMDYNDFEYFYDGCAW